MARSYSAPFKRTINRTSAPETPLLLLEIDHSALGSPIRVVNDNDDLTHNGDLFTALQFRVTLPDDRQHGLPRATIEIDNVGQVLTSWIESSGGGRGATCRFIQVLRSAPNTAELDLTLTLSNVSMDWQVVRGTLSYEDLLNRSGVAVTYSPQVAPGLF